MVFRCNGVVQVVCSTWCLLCLLLLAIGTITTHRAFSGLIPAVIDMPENLRDGLHNVLNFDGLEASSSHVKNLSSQALAKCQLTDPQVGCEVALSPDNGTHNVAAEVDGISAAFSDVLDEIEKVTTDEYLGIEDFESTAQRLAEMKAELNKLKGENGSVPCATITEGFCPIWKSGGEIVDSMDEVREALSKITDNDAVKSLEDSSARLAGLHLIPYIGWISILFYACFFCSEKVVTICRGGSCGACVACSCHALFFTLFFVISIAIAGVAIAGSVLARDYAIEEPFRGKSTAAALIDHVEVKFPDFYDVVLKDFIAGLRSVRSAFLINALASIMLSFHTIFSCCCGIYNDAGKASK